MTEKTVKVRVSDRWSVVHDDKRYVKGDTLTVPASVADATAGLSASPPKADERSSRCGD